ncbi:MAG: hypothetical protein ACI8Z7_000565 [Candidatus Nanohaloarchaea archaeon]|jgi:hypothetical protein
MSIDIKDELEEDDGNYQYKETYDIDGVTYNVDIKEGRGESDEDTMPEVYISEGLTDALLTCDYSELGKELEESEDLPQEIEDDLWSAWFNENLE